MEHTPILPPGVRVAPMGVIPLPEGQFAVYALTDPPAAIRTMSRGEIGDTVEALIAILDVTEGDPDFEDATDAEDDFAFSPLAVEFSHGPGCEIADEPEQAYVEWHTKPANTRRHGQPEYTLGREDDEEDDPAEEDDHAGQCTEDEISCGMPYFGRTGAGCELSDPGGCEHDGREPEDGY